jgi:hypothetical protein
MRMTPPATDLAFRQIQRLVNSLVNPTQGRRKKQDEMGITEGIQDALGKGEVDSSILSGSTSGNANGSAAFRRFQAQMKRDRKSSEVRK